MEQLLSPSQAAKLLDVHPCSVRRLCAQGKLPGRRVGWSRVFQLGDVVRLAEERHAKRRAAR
jgi:excisionase family DNA binding protein